MDDSGEPPPCQYRPRRRARSWTLVAAGLAGRLVTLPRVPDEHDSFLFLRGVARFSVAESRPHWPCYPVYVWAGKLATAVLRDPLLALHVVSAASAALVAWPLALVVRSWARSLGAPSPRDEWAGFGAAGLWLAAPVSWVTGSQIIADPLGLLCGVSVLALAISGRSGRSRAWIAAAALGGLMLGVRLVNVTMLGPIAWKGWQARRERWWRLPAPACLLVAFAAGVLPWAAWLAAREPQAYVRAGRAHVRGHFHEWGESILTDRDPAVRPWRAVAAFVIHGIGGGTPRMGWPRAAAAAGWMAALGIGIASARPLARSRVARLAFLWGAPHLLYLFLAHDVAFPKYTMPAVALAAMAGGLAVLAPRPYGIAVVAAAVAATVLVSAPLAWHQRRQPPVEDAAARFLAAQERAALIIVEVPALPSYLHELAPAVRAMAVGDAASIPRWSAPWQAEGRRVFATAVPPDEPSQWIPVAHFCRDPLIDPRLSAEVWLFAPVTQAPGPPVVACAEGG